MTVLFAANHIKSLVKVFIVSLVLSGIFITTIINSGLFHKRPIKELHPFRKKIIHILQWGGKNVAPFHFMGQGNSAFIKNKCKYTNCYVTDRVSYVNLTDFDAVVFNGRTVVKMKSSQLPQRRSPRQKYIFGAAESAGRFPACNKVLDNFFNWTWTYKLSSDFRFGYITIYDLKGKEIGPAVDMKWPVNMTPIGKDIKAKLSSKSKAAAWFVSHCKTINKREYFASQLNKELNKLGWNVDVYGSCGKLKCPKSNRRECDKKLMKEYYFYLSFENSFAEDYVTEKLLTALNNFAVPVVFGISNYTRRDLDCTLPCCPIADWLRRWAMRVSEVLKPPESLGLNDYFVTITTGIDNFTCTEKFLPPDSYLDARKLGPKNLARTMVELIADKDRYYDFFKWRNHFIYKQTIMNADICKLCEVLNDERKVNTFSVWKDFRRWWNGRPYKENC